MSALDEGSALLTCRLASLGLLSCCALMVGLSTPDNPGWPTPAADVEAVLSTLPLPPDIDPHTFASAVPPDEVFAARSSHKKLVLGKPVADGDLRSGFGMRWHPILGFSRMHTGVDWATRLGAPIMAAADGAVIKAERALGYGLRVEIQHAEVVVTTYSHLSRFGEDIAPGTEVRQGQVIGFVGSTGLSTGPHLHYEVMVSDQFVDPMEVMEIYVPDGASVAAKVEKTTPSADEQAAILAAERLAALQTRQSPAAKTSAALAAPPNQPSPKPVQSAEHTPRQRIAAAPTQHQTPVEPVPLPPIRLASLGTAEPAADVRQTRSDAPEPKTSATDKNASGRQAPAPRVTSSRISPLKAPQPPLVKMTKVEPGKAAEPRTGTLPKTEQQRRDAASKQNLRSGLVKAHQIAFATPNRANSKPEFRSPPRAVTPPALVPSLANLSASSGGAVERATASSPRTPDRTPAVLRPGSSGRTQTAGLAQPQAAAAEVEAARRRIEARLQAKERRLRVTLKSICTGC